MNFEPRRASFLPLSGLSRVAALAVAAFAWLASTFAQSPADYAVPLSASIQRSPPQIRLNWPADANATNYFLFRKRLAATSWETVTPLESNAAEYLDSDVAVGVSYEYKLLKSTPALAALGLLCAAIDAPPVEDRGTLLLLVDETHADGLAAELALLTQDLIGDGWKVMRHDVPRDAPPSYVKSLIVSDYLSDSANVKCGFLLGHVPVPYSGDFAPDGHADHTGAWPADGYYADIDGFWTDGTVNDFAAARPQNRNTPGDGKFDQTFLPSEVELQIGRVDFFDMPAFARTEVELLRQYLNRDHAFRHGLTPVERRGLIQDGFGLATGEPLAANAWRNFAALLGANATSALPWFPTLSSNAYLWAYGSGSGSYTAIQGLGDTATFASSGSRAVFNMLFGSYLGDWEAADSILRAPLACEGLGLASVWGNRPAWYFHRMGLGHPIGDSVRVSMNRGGLYEAELWTRGVHTALMGDPALRLRSLPSPTGLTVIRAGGGARLTWAAPTAAVSSYHIYRGTNAGGPFARLTGAPIASLAYTDAHPVPGATYMVRAISLEETTGGSYFNLSQGVFAELDLPTVSLRATKPIASRLGAAAGEVVFSRTGSLVAPLTVSFASRGSAIDGVDYEAIGGELVIAAGHRSASVTVMPRDASVPQVPHTVRIVLNPGARYTRAAPAFADMVIVGEAALFHPFSDRYTGILHAPGGPSGFVAVNIAANGSVTVAVRMGGAAVSAVGRFDTAGECLVTFSGAIAGQLRMTLDLSGGHAAIQGSLSEAGGAVATFVAQRPASPPGLVGVSRRYTVALLPGSAGPRGIGWGIATLDQFGRGRLAASLADRTPVSTEMIFDADAHWPFFASLYGGRGWIAGDVTLDETNETSDALGTLDWFKPAVAGGQYYPSGFATSLSLAASRYLPPGKYTPMLSYQSAIGNAVWLAEGAGLANPLQGLLTIGRRGATAVPPAARPSIDAHFDPGAGLMSGFFPDPATAKSLPFRGVVLQKQRRAVGYFARGSETGEMRIEQNPAFPGRESGGLNGDWTRPAVQIQSPAEGARVAEVHFPVGTGTPPPALLIQGAARDDSTIASVQYQISSGGVIRPLSTASGTNNWLFPIYLAPADGGWHTVFVKAIDANGNESALASRSFRYVVVRDLLVTVEGRGAVTAGFLGATHREIGQRYEIKATPLPGFRFSGWSGSLTSASPVIRFTMSESFSIQAKFELVQ